MQTVLIWTLWIYLGVLILICIPVGAAYLFRATLSKELRSELNDTAPGLTYLVTLGWPLYLALLLNGYIQKKRTDRLE